MPGAQGRQEVFGVVDRSPEAALVSQRALAEQQLALGQCLARDVAVFDFKINQVNGGAGVG